MNTRFARVKARLVVVLGAFLISACSGQYGGAPSVSGTTNGTSPASAKSMQEHFSQNVQPNLTYCRTCHIPGGVADVDNGRKFMLSADGSGDLAALQSSWDRLGGNNPISRILLMASGQETPHSGGSPWPVDSAAYQNMQILLKCFADPLGCDALLAGASTDTTQQWPLLGPSQRGGHAWSRFCADQPDDAVLPVDPRTLIQPGVNQGKAVYFNAWHKNCHIAAAPDDAAPHTCGQWRERIARGTILMEGNGVLGQAANFTGDVAADQIPPGLYITADQYNVLWATWGLTQRPANFDQLVSARWGVALGQARNPYPLPGENPNTSNGGSGQLPTALTQLRNADGSWSGKIGMTCHMCHSGQVGLPNEPGLPGALYGSNSLSDIGVMGRDLLVSGDALGGLLVALGKSRGLGNITNFQVFNAVSLPVSPTNIPNYLLEQTSGSSGSEDPPVWWNYGHRPLKFFDGGMSSDAQRITLSADFSTPLAIPNAQTALDWIELHDQDAEAWLLDRTAPAWPYGYCSNADGTPALGDNARCINRPLAEQGAILFHSKDLFALPQNVGMTKPRGGNGSCASCHGAYSPRFVHDRTYLDTPALEGIAGYIVPRDLIGTDPQRVDANDQEVARTFENDWFGYPEQAGTENDCGDQNLDRIRGDRENGYLAPPLYGVWATAPYFHNGSVPDVWDVLKSSDRPAIWRRVSQPNTTGLNVVMGFDPSFQRAYDSNKMGWKYAVIPCDPSSGATPYLACDPATPEADPLLESTLSLIYANGGLAWNLPNLINIPLTNAQVEDRKIYNTHLYSQSNSGHTFADVLTDHERRAIIEYLKTL